MNVRQRALILVNTGHHQRRNVKYTFCAIRWMVPSTAANSPESRAVKYRVVIRLGDDFSSRSSGLPAPEAQDRGASHERKGKGGR
jgi:hypothetical protein